MDDDEYEGAFNSNSEDPFPDDEPVVWKNPDSAGLGEDEEEYEPVTQAGEDGGALDMYARYESEDSPAGDDGTGGEDGADDDTVPEPHKNKAAFLDRNKILLVILAAGAALIVFTTVILPLLRTDKKSKKQMEKASAQKAPSELLYWSAPPEESTPQFADSNSAADRHTEETQSLAERFPPPMQPSGTAPVQVPATQGTAAQAAISFPTTNRNEQQKPLAHVSLNATETVSGALSGQNLLTGSSMGYAQPSAQYTPATLAANLESYMQNQSSYIAQNGQAQKNSFFSTEDRDTGTYRWNTEFSLWKGTVIPAVLETAIDTDLPGVVIAAVTTNIYSSLDGKYILIPQGSKLYAIYNSSVTYGQGRVQVAWNTLIRPDGLEINLGNLNGVDAQGRSGYSGFTNTHPLEYAKALGLIAMYSVLDTKVGNIEAAQNNAYAQNAIADTYSEVQKMNQQILDRALDIQPTIRIAAGTEVNLITNVTMDLPPAASVPATKYQR